MKYKLDYEKVVKVLREELKTYIIERNIKSLIIGISGGIDSALVAAIANPVCKELKIPLMGRYISIKSNKKDEEERADLVGKTLCFIYDNVNMDVSYDVLSKTLSIDNEIDNFNYKIRQGNIKARLRMINLYNLASYNKGMVLSTDNYTEYLLGFWTIAGDIGDYVILRNLWKHEVYELAEWICDNEFKIDAPHSKYNKKGIALKNCIDAIATDGLGITNSDLEQILPEWNGSSKNGYYNVDMILSLYINLEQGDKNNPVVKRHINSDFKRNWPVTIDRNKFDNDMLYK